MHTDARGYVRAIAEGRFEEAYLIARGPNPFASICGRVCGAPCEAACRRGKMPIVQDDGRFTGPDQPVAIRALKRFACEHAGVDVRPPAEVLDAARGYVPLVSAHVDEMAALLRSLARSRIRPANGERVVIIGSGPAGLSAAHDLALLGLAPVVLEKEPVASGMLWLGVPAYRLPRELIRREVAVVEALGVEIRCGIQVGEDVTLAQLREESAAVLIAVGCKAHRRLGVPGERGPGVYGGVDLLRAVALGETLHMGPRVVVIGGGNVAYDVARTVVRQAAYDAARTAARVAGTREVRLVSLESLEEMPADTLEILEGDEEGIARHNGWGPVEIKRDASGRVCGVRLRRCLRVYDAARRFAPVFDDADVMDLPCDTVLLAAGQAPDVSFLEEGGKDIEQFRPGWPKVDPDTLMTTAPGVFVAGDLAHGTRLLIDAVASGKRAARSIYQVVTGRRLEPEWHEQYVHLEDYQRELGYESVPRVPLRKRSPEERLRAQEVEVELCHSREAAMLEASRCFDCGVTPVFDGTRCILCGGCADVCPTLCLKLVPLSGIAVHAALETVIDERIGPGADLLENSAILKDEDRCIRCALCVERCPVRAIGMERVVYTSRWSQR